MRVKNIEQRVARLATLVNGWTKQGGVPRIERDLALDELRRLYDALLDLSDAEGEVEAADKQADDPEQLPIIEPEPEHEPEPEVVAEAVAVSEPMEEKVSEVVSVHDPLADFDDALDIDALLGLSDEEKPQAVAEVESTPEPAPVVDEVVAPEPEPTVEPQSEPAPEPKVARGGGLFDIEDIPVRQKSSRKMISLYNTPTTPVAPPMPEPKTEPAPAPVAPAPSVAPTPQPTPQPAPQSQSVEPQRVADVLGSGRKVLGDVSHNEIVPTPPMSKIADLRKAIGINDKFIMLRDLFAGDEAQYNATIDALNSFASLDECMIYIVENFAWNPDSEGAKLIVSLIERKLS